MVAATGISHHHMFPSHSNISPEGNPLAGQLNFDDTGFSRGGMSHLQLPHISSTDLDWFQQALDQSHQSQTPTFGSGLS
jgi:hypothetical protein